MAIGEQFAGLNMEQLIGGPLSAAAKASTQLANTTADFINRVGFDNKGALRTVAFGYQKRSVNEDGTTNLDEMKVAVPMLAIVPIPNLQIDEVNILFDMEVKQSERSESGMDMSASLSGSMNFGIVKVSISGSVSAHQSNTRSTDNSAKYHVDVRATNHGTPEGLARVLDMMAANVAPSLVGSTIKDANGQSLSEASRAKAERLKRLRQEVAQIETRLSAAQSNLEDKVAQLKRFASAQQNVYAAEMTRLMNTLDKSNEEDNKKAEEYGGKASTVGQSWNDMQNQAASVVKMIADSGESNLAEVSELFALLAWKDQDAKKYESGEQHYAAIRQAQNSAVAAQNAVTGIEKELFDKKAEYSAAVSGVNTEAATS
ncbi:MAG: DUF2589 domain-containing protein [Candidatus Gastranaerophilales bacterium]|nr:DUF2589 domain-containing protein [Candidatus Gastranaerophilales bacterium]